MVIFLKVFFWHNLNIWQVWSLRWKSDTLLIRESSRVSNGKLPIWTVLRNRNFLPLSSTWGSWCSFFFSFLLCPNVATSWSWSYGSWIYNYLCNKWLSPSTMWVRIPLRRGVLDTTLYVIKFVSHLRQVGGFLRFPLSIKLSGTI